MCSMLRSMSSRVRAPHTVVTRPTAMYGSMIAMAGEHRRARRALSSRGGREPRERRAGASPARRFLAATCRSARRAFVYRRPSTIKEDAMKYMLLIHQGDTPTPRDPEAWARLSEDEQNAVFADYRAITETPGVTPGLQLDEPDTATTVRVQDGRTLTTDGPFVVTKEALGGWMIFEADNLDAAIERAARIPAARLGGAIEVRPIVEW